jgi:hypothetical protein
VQVVADHEHVQVLVDGVDRQGAGGVGAPIGWDDNNKIAILLYYIV